MYTDSALSDLETFTAAARGRSVSVATKVCPRQTKVDGHVLCHIRVALRLRGR